MSQHTHQNSVARIVQLDGFRGIAILLVILNHLRLTHIYDVIPPALHPVMSSLLNSGHVGVSMLFLLSGYLMARYYPAVPSIRSFWQKRYTRIVPAFFAMTTALAIIRFVWTWLNPVTTIVILVTTILAFGVTWDLIRNHPQRRFISVLLFTIYALLQVAAVTGYFLLQSQVSPAVYFISWTTWMRQIVIYLVNASMANPFGTYVPLLDGAYWSIITEMWFYLLYPLLFLPIISHILRKQSMLFTLLCIVCAFLFFYAISLLFPSILLFEMLNMQLAVYFVAGVGIGLTQETRTITQFLQFLNRLPAWLTIPVSFGVVAGLPVFRDLTGTGRTVDMLTWVIPVSIVFLYATGDTPWSRLLRTPVLVRLGHVSYSLYLTHTIAIEMLIKAGEPQTPAAMVLATGGSVVIMMGLATLLHYFLERPYFVDKLRPNTTSVNSHAPMIPAIRSVHAGLAVMLVLIWYGYHVPAPLTSRVTNHRYRSDRYIPITQQPSAFTFVGAHANLGLILLHFRTLDDGEVGRLGLTRGPETQRTMTAQVVNNDGIVSENSYAIYQMHESRFHPIGIPIETESENTSYTLTLTAPDDSLQKLAVINDGIAYRTVYMQSKSDLLAHPRKLIETIVEKLTQPFAEPAAGRVLLLSVPIWGLLLIDTTMRTRQRRQ